MIIKKISFKLGWCFYDFDRQKNSNSFRIQTYWLLNNALIIYLMPIKLTMNVEEMYLLLENLNSLFLN